MKIWGDRLLNFFCWKGEIIRFFQIDWRIYVKQQGEYRHSDFIFLWWISLWRLTHKDICTIVFWDELLRIPLLTMLTELFSNNNSSWIIGVSADWLFRGLWATCPDFESYHSGEWESHILAIQSHIRIYYIDFLYFASL